MYDYINWEAVETMTAEHCGDIMARIFTDWQLLRNAADAIALRVDNDTATETDYVVLTALQQRIQTLVRYHDDLSDRKRTLTLAEYADAA